jgi:hypothetical protein
MAYLFAVLLGVCDEAAGGVSISMRDPFRVVVWSTFELDWTVRNMRTDLYGKTESGDGRLSCIVCFRRSVKVDSVLEFIDRMEK